MFILSSDYYFLSCLFFFSEIHQFPLSSTRFFNFHIHIVAFYLLHMMFPLPKSHNLRSADGCNYLLSDVRSTLKAKVNECLYE